MPDFLFILFDFVSEERMVMPKAEHGSKHIIIILLTLCPFSTIIIIIVRIKKLIDSITPIGCTILILLGSICVLNSQVW